MDEFQIIKWIKNFFNSKFIGDDCFNFNNFLISKDLLIENVHFILKDNLYEIGAKSIISNVSDILSSGGKPLYFLLALGIPENFNFQKLKNFFKGLKHYSEKYNVQLAGGDISKSKKDFFISITIIGKVLKKTILRSNAKNNDNIYVIGELGDSEIGLKILKDKINFPEKEYFLKKHFIKELYPEVIFELVEKNIVNSMIDVSDGFLLDLEHILDESNKSAFIYVKNLPVSENFKKLANFLSKEEFYTIPLTSGEEYSIIFTSDKKYDKEIKKISEKHKVKITFVGEITDRKEKKFYFNDIDLNIAIKGYKHF